MLAKIFVDHNRATCLVSNSKRVVSASGGDEKAARAGNPKVAGRGLAWEKIGDSAFPVLTHPDLAITLVIGSFGFAPVHTRCGKLQDLPNLELAVRFSTPCFPGPEPELSVWFWCVQRFMRFMHRTWACLQARLGCYSKAFIVPFIPCKIQNQYYSDNPEKNAPKPANLWVWVQVEIWVTRGFTRAHL